VCSSGVGFDPVIDGQRRYFDVAGLYQGLFVMSDRTTGSIWTHYDGTVLRGALAGTGTAMEQHPLAHTRWSTWLADHPDTRVLAWNPRYASEYSKQEPGGAGLGGMFLSTLRSLDDRLPENELVLGVDSGHGFKAYRLDAAAASGLTVVDDEIGDAPVVVAIDRGQLFGMAFSGVVDGRRPTFREAAGGIADDTDATWTREGVATDGTSSDLDFVTSFVTEWYGWSAYHPGTVIWDGG